LPGSDYPKSKTEKYSKTNLKRRFGMETTKRIMISLILVFLTAGPTRSMDQAAEVSGTRAASCLVKITCDSAILPLNLETIDYLLHSSGVGGKAARDILDISPDQAYDLFTVEYVEGDTSGLGSYGFPPRSSRGRSGLDEYGSDMSDDDEYMMMEMEQPNADQNPFLDTLKSRGSSSVSRSTSRTQPGTGRSSSTRRTTTSRTRPTTSTGSSYGRSRRGRGDSSYAYTTTSKAPQQPMVMATKDTTDVQTDLFSLNVHLPEDIEPLAKEYMNALVYNLRQVLTNAYDVYREDINTMSQQYRPRR
jgi:hypothetical protein